MKRFFMRLIRSIIDVLSNTRGEVRIPPKTTSPTNNQKTVEQNGTVAPSEIKIEGTTYFVNSIFDQKSKETIADKLRYLLGLD